MKQDELTIDFLQWLSRPLEHDSNSGFRSVFNDGMDDSTQSAYMTAKLLREFLGETSQQLEEYRANTIKKNSLDYSFGQNIIAIGRNLEGTAICDQSASWDSHYNSWLEQRVRTVDTLAKCIGFNVKSISDELCTKLNGRVVRCKKNGNSAGEREAKSELNSLSIIPLTTKGDLDISQTYRTAIARSISRYQTVRSTLHPALQNYNRKADVMYQVANLALIGNLPIPEIQVYLKTISTMNFEDAGGK